MTATGRHKFDAFCATKTDKRYLFTAINDWCIHVGYDERGYVVLLQRTPGESLRVRAGCRYLALPEARKHWTSAFRNRTRGLRSTARRMLALIDIAIATAKHKGWIDGSVKFNPAPRKVRR